MQNSPISYYEYVETVDESLTTDYLTLLAVGIVRFKFFSYLEEHYNVGSAILATT